MDVNAVLFILSFSFNDHLVITDVGVDIEMDMCMRAEYQALSTKVGDPICIDTTTYRIEPGYKEHNYLEIK